MNEKGFLQLVSPIDDQEISLSEEQRYEFKLTVDNGSTSLGRSWLRMHHEGFRIAYPARLVNNLYLDTGDLQSFQENRWGIGKRAKVRLRWYGQSETNTVVNPILELKFKNNLIGDKVRQKLSCTLDLNQPFGEILKIIRSQAAPHWQARLNSYYQPSLMNQYQREYFVSPDGAIRATLDYDLISYNQRFSAYPNLKRPLPPGNSLIIEIKASPQYQERLQEAMAFFPIPRGRNSKYVNGVSGGPF